MLEELSRYHIEWIRILVSFGCSKYDAEDIIHDMYLLVDRDYTLEEIRYGKDDINKYFIYIVLKNLYLQKVKNKHKEHETLDFCVEFEESDYNHDKDIAMTKLLDNIFDDVADLSVFERRLFELYFNVSLQNKSLLEDLKLSMRDIHNGSNVSTSTIFTTLKRIKDNLKRRYAEDVLDFRNGDYEKV